MRHNDLPDHDRGLSHDLPTLLSRRRMLTLLGGAGAVALAACATNSVTTASTSSAPGGSSAPGTSPAGSDGAGVTRIPDETAGPFPGDGSNGANVLTESGIVRRDITRSFGSGSAVARGVPLTIALTVVDTKNQPMAGAAVYLWHCDIDGQYSLYSAGITQENYLRGVQAADAAGSVTFTSIYPAAYSGRWPHIHFEIYPSLAQATTVSGRLVTSQLALPDAANKLVYATAGYNRSLANLGGSSLATDNVFRDGYDQQLATVTGTVAGGMTAALTVGV